MTDPKNDSSIKSISYRDAGVDIDAGANLVERIKPMAAATSRPGVLGGLGGFGAFFELPKDKYNEPVLVSGTDGVGTKLKLAVELGMHDTVGIDLVAMCVNDILVSGAEPLFFLDYYATGHLNVDVAAGVISGIAKGCEIAGCALIGGETAEMPGLYYAGDYDLAGFCVGIAEKSAILKPENVKPGQVLIALASSGAHSNGYSLIRKIIHDNDINLAMEVDGQPIAERLMEPTRIYVRTLLPLIRQGSIQAMANITGGGITHNLPRALPNGTAAEIDLDTWTLPTVFSWLRANGNIVEQEMLQTFNCGVGMVLCVEQNDAEQVMQTLSRQGETCWEIGRVVATQESNPFVTYQNSLKHA